MAAEEKKSEGFWSGMAMLAFILWIFSGLWIPHKTGPISGDANIAAYQAITKVLNENGQNVVNTMRVDEQFLHGLTVFVLGLQQSNRWKWNHPADGILSEEYLEHLEKNAYSPDIFEMDKGRYSILDFVSAVKTLKKDGYLYVMDAFSATSLDFLNAILDGWTDDAVIYFFYSETPEIKAAARADYKIPVMMGRSYYHTWSLVAFILGTFFSLGGVVAVIIASQAQNSGEAFKLGFWTEVAESVLYEVGYFWTVGEFAEITALWFGITFGVALIMGCVAMGVNKATHRRRA